MNTVKRPHKGPLPHEYKTELDATDECNADRTSRYQQLIGILRWDVDLGRIDIKFEVALMSEYQMNPRERHLEALYLMFQFIWKNTNKRQVMDPYTPMIDEILFRSNADWVGFYRDIAEENQPQLPEPLGKPV